MVRHYKRGTASMMMTKTAEDWWSIPSWICWHKRGGRGRRVRLRSCSTPLGFFVASDAIDHSPVKSMKFVHGHWSIYTGCTNCVFATEGWIFREHSTRQEPTFIFTPNSTRRNTQIRLQLIRKDTMHMELTIGFVYPMLARFLSANLQLCFDAGNLGRVIYGWWRKNREGEERKGASIHDARKVLPFYISFPLICTLIYAI